jgi:hypothetical protein
LGSRGGGRLGLADPRAQFRAKKARIIKTLTKLNRDYPFTREEVASALDSLGIKATLDNVYMKIKVRKRFKT